MEFFRTVLIISIVIECYIDSVYILIDFCIFSTDFCIIVYKVSPRIFIVSQLINTVVQFVIIKWCFAAAYRGAEESSGNMLCWSKKGRFLLRSNMVCLHSNTCWCPALRSRLHNQKLIQTSIPELEWNRLI